MGGVIVQEGSESSVAVLIVFVVMTHFQSLLNLVWHVVERLNHLEMFLLIPVCTEVFDVSKAYSSELQHHLRDDLVLILRQVDSC